MQSSAISIFMLCIIVTTHAFDESTIASIAPLSRQYANNLQHLKCRLGVPRGGSITEVDEQQHSMQSDDGNNKGSSNSSSQRTSSLLPLIDTKTASLALRLTCETNRRLYRGTIGSTLRHTAKTSDETASSSVGNEHDNAAAHGMMHSPYQQHHHSQQHYYQQQEQGQIMVPSSIPPAISSVTEEERAEERRKEETTIFHSIEPWKPSNDSSEDKKSIIRRGISRWGPDIDKYLDTLLCAIGLGTVDDVNADCESSSSSTETTSTVSTLSTHTSNSKNKSPMEDERQLILSLTMLYLDHSISLDTPRHLDPQTGQPWYPPCPQILPRTVHRLVLTAMIIAAKTVRGGGDASTSLLEASNKLYGNEDEKYIISGVELEQMEQWMLHSLGADASGTGGQWQISAEVVQDFMRKWSETFYPQRLLAHDERNRSRMQKLERFWREKTGAFGNQHGQYGGDHGHGHWNGAAAEQYQHYQQQY